MAYDVITPNFRRNPQFVEVELSPDLTDAQLATLANLITMTPGTLSVKVADDRSTLIVHAMFVDDLNELKRSFKEDYERRVCRVF